VLTCLRSILGVLRLVENEERGLLLPRRMPNPAPQPSKLPRAVGLERSSHGVTQSKMVTKFLTLNHENKGRLVLVHYPSKLPKTIYNKLTRYIYISAIIKSYNFNYSLHLGLQISFFQDFIPPPPFLNPLIICPTPLPISSFFI
jgi:hypothetical protein